MSGIIEILKNLSSKASINNGFITLLIKITGIAILTEFAVSVCKDSGKFHCKQSRFRTEK